MLLNPRLSFTYLIKGQQISKAFFLETPLPKKTNEILDKILPYEAKAEFCQIFRSFFWAMEFQEKSL